MLALAALSLSLLFGATDSVDHSAWDGILKQNVREERVDYLNIRAHHSDDLNRYLDRLAATDFHSLTKPERLAALINLYNATMVQAILPRLDATYSTANADWGIFDEPIVRMSRETISLNQLEHEKIRASFDEPRIHVALVCGARSCPPLIPRAYRASDLEETLEQGMRAFANDPYRNPVNPEEKKIALSQLFNWYADDFGGTEQVLSYVQRYHAKDLSGYITEFTEYHWELNIAKPTKGHWVKVGNSASLREAQDGRPTVEVKADEYLRVLQNDGEWLQVDRGLGRGNGWIGSDQVVDL